jgi:O-antigen/teichoic acid export membrane protein
VAADDATDEPDHGSGHGTHTEVPADGTASHATTWIAVGSALNGLGALLFQVAGTRTLGAVGYAPIGVLWTLQYLWVAVAVTALEAYVTRLVTIGGPGNATLVRFLRLLTRWLVATALVTAVIGVALAGPLFEELRELGVVLGLLVLGYGWYGVVRGRAAGVERFRTYGAATISESLIRLAAALVVLTWVATTTSLAWVMPIGPLAVGVWAWARRDAIAARTGPPAPGAPGTSPPAAPRDTLPAPAPGDATPADAPGNTAPADGARDTTPVEAPGDTAPADATQPATGVARRFLAAASTANAVVQFLLAGGPIVLLPLGAAPADVSVFFTTITAARVPMTFALNGGLSRLLPPLTRLAQAGDAAGLRRASARAITAILGLAVVAAATAAAVGPEVMVLVFGAEFRPDRTFVTVVAVSTVLAVGGLLLDQVYIAMGRETSLPRVWLVALALAGVLVVLLPGTPTMRVAVAFALATAIAVTALSIPLLRRQPR